MLNKIEKLTNDIAEGFDCCSKIVCVECDHFAKLAKCKPAMIANRLVEKGWTKQRWISVTEQLPQENEPLGVMCEVVQVLLNSGRVTVGLCNRGLKLWYHLPINRTSLVAHNYDNTPVVAWQPLAKAPGGEL